MPVSRRECISIYLCIFVRNVYELQVLQWKNREHSGNESWQIRLYRVYRYRVFIESTGAGFLSSLQGYTWLFIESTCTGSLSSLQVQGFLSSLQGSTWLFIESNGRGYIMSIDWRTQLETDKVREEVSCIDSPHLEGHLMLDCFYKCFRNYLQNDYNDMNIRDK